MFIISRIEIFQVFCDFSGSRQRRHVTRQTIRARGRLSAQIFIRPIRNKLTRELVYYTRRRWSTSNIQHRVNTIYLQRPGRESSWRDFGTRVTAQRVRKYNSANYACHRKPLSAARICEIVSPPSLQKYTVQPRGRFDQRRHRFARSLPR